jgi:predicted membrane-bound mannosyltransferase
MIIEKKYIALFWVIIIALSIHLKFYNIIFLAPQSTDMWRQADCLSIAINYMQHGFHFFEPQVHFQFNQQGYAAGEFPLIYFLAAILFKVFGVKYYLFRGINLLIFFIGLNYLVKLSAKYIQDIFYSIILVILFFCTPIVFFYANNYLSDVPSLSFNIIGLYFFSEYIDFKGVKYFGLALLFLTLAGLLKANASILLIAILSTTMFHLMFSKGKPELVSLFSKSKTIIIAGFMLSIAIISSWYIYAIYFNKMHQTVFFGTQAMAGWPLWELTFLEFKSTLSIFKMLTLSIISGKNVLLFLTAMVLIAIACVPKNTV